MRKKPFILCALLGATSLTACIYQGPAPSTEEWEIGRNLFNGKGRCFECHGIDGNISRGIPDYLKTELRDVPDLGTLSLRQDLTRQQWKEIIFSGRGNTAMPPFGGVLTDKDIENLIHYLKKLQGVAIGMEMNAALLHGSDPKPGFVDALLHDPLYSLHIVVDPADTEVEIRVPAIPYSSRLQLPKGAYLVRLHKPGFISRERWIVIDGANQTWITRLVREEGQMGGHRD